MTDVDLRWALFRIRIMRKQAMRVARIIERSHPEVHEKMMLTATICDDATTKLNEHGMERVAYDIDAENEFRAERHHERISLEDQYEQEDLR